MPAALILLLTMLGSALPGAAGAGESYPAKPVRVVVPYAPGGSNDFVSRLVSPKLSESWKQPVIVDNRPGAGSLVGTEIVVRAAPDGYTLLATSGALAVSAALSNLSFDPLTDLAPVALMAEMPYVLGIHPSLPVRSTAELISFAKGRPGKLAFGSAGTGTSTHLTGELFKSLAKIDMLHVPYKGGGPALTALAGNEVQVLFNVVTGMLPQAKAGRVRALAVSSATRVAVAPDLPTIAESGLPGFQVASGYTLFAPGGTPAGIVKQVNAEINRALEQPDVKERFRTLGVLSIVDRPEALAAYLKAEIARWGKLGKQTGIKVE